MYEKTVKIEKGMRVKNTCSGRIGKVEDVYDNMAAVRYGEGIRVTPLFMLDFHPLMKKNAQVVERLSDGIEANMLLIVSPDGGIQKEGKWTPEGKKRFYEMTKQRDIKVSISLNGTFCLTENGWEVLKGKIDRALKRGEVT